MATPARSVISLRPVLQIQQTLSPLVRAAHSEDCCSRTLSATPARGSAATGPALQFSSHVLCKARRIALPCALPYALPGVTTSGLPECSAAPPFAGTVLPHFDALGHPNHPESVSGIGVGTVQWVMKSHPLGRSTYLCVGRKSLRSRHLVNDFMQIVHGSVGDLPEQAR